MSRIFGLFPITINSRFPEQIIFTWRSPRTIFSIVFIFASFITSIFVLKDQMTAGSLTARNIVGVIFFGSSCATYVLLFKISQKFQILMTNWMHTENVFMCFEYKLPSKSWSLYKRILLCTILYLIVSILEHFFYVGSKTYTLIYELNYCNRTKSDAIEILITRHLRFIFYNAPFHYNHFAGIVFEYLNFSYTFCWYLLDLFIALICIGIAFLFEKLNLRMQKFRNVLVHDALWGEFRLHYVKIQELTELINELIGELTVLACFIDGYFILVQLLNIRT